MTLITNPTELGPSDCVMGFSESLLQSKMDEQQFARFSHWMRGQTVALCSGQLFDHETRTYVESCDGHAHGTVYYSHDVYRFLAGLPIID